MATLDPPSTRGTQAAPTTTANGTASTPSPRARLGQDPARPAYLVLRGAFVIAPVVFGVDKFTNWLVHWDQYLAPALSEPLPISARQAMYVVGVIEVVAGVLVALHARLGAVVVAAWLAGIIVNLLLIPGYYDIAVRDLGLLLSALALQRLASRHDPRPHIWPRAWPWWATSPPGPAAGSPWPRSSSQQANARAASPRGMPACSAPPLAATDAARIRPPGSTDGARTRIRVTPPQLPGHRRTGTVWRDSMSRSPTSPPAPRTARPTGSSSR